MESLGQQRPEIPVVGGATQIGARVALHRLVEIGEFQRVAEKEDRRVVADEVPVAFLGVELEGKAANITLGIGCTALAGNGRHPGEHRRFLADLAEHLGAGKAGDVVRHGEGAESAGTFGMHAPLGDHLAVKVGQFLQKPHILQQHRATRSGGQAVLVIGYRCAESRGQFLVHNNLLEGVRGSTERL